MLRLDEPAEGRMLADVMTGFSSEDLSALILGVLEDGCPVEARIDGWLTSG